MIGAEKRASGDSSVDGQMGLLLDEATFSSALHRGDILEGVLMRVDKEGALVDIGRKSEGVIPSHEMQSLGPDGLKKIRVGDPVLVYVLETETRDGEVVLSLDKAGEEKGWRFLQGYYEGGELVEGEVMGYNRGGLLVEIEGVQGFVPASQVTGVPQEEAEGSNRLAQMMGRRLRVKVIELNRKRNRVILSERVAVQDWRNQQRERLLVELREGEVRRGRVSSICSFGVFVDLGGADGLAPLSELSWE